MLLKQSLNISFLNLTSVSPIHGWNIFMFFYPQDLLLTQKNCYRSLVSIFDSAFTCLFFFYPSLSLFCIFLFFFVSPMDVVSLLINSLSLYSAIYLSITHISVSFFLPIHLFWISNVSFSCLVHFFSDSKFPPISLYI